ncbi:hypothetical protein JCM3774_002720 [Rhodotorula dairenensis]
MTLIKIQQFDLLIDVPPGRKTVSRTSSSKSTSSVNSPASSRARSTPSTSPDLLPRVKREVDEDAAPPPERKRAKKRSLAPGLVEEEAEMDRAKREFSMERSRGPTADVKSKWDDPDEDVKPKLEDKEDKPERFKWPRPDDMQGVNLFRLEDLDERGAPFVVPPDSDLMAGLRDMLDHADGGFKRVDLSGPRQNTSWRLDGTRPLEYEFDRATFNSEGNLSCRAAGQAMLSLENVYGSKVDDRIAVWVRQPRRATKPYEGEIWFPFGVYRTYWNGAAEAGEFDGLLLTPDDKEPTADGWEKQKEVIEAHSFYTKKMTSYGKHVYARTIIERGKEHAEIGVETSQETETAQRQVFVATKGYLSRNQGLNIGYTIWVYDGPITKLEIQDAVDAREARREEDRREATDREYAAAKKAAKAKTKAEAQAKRKAAAAAPSRNKRNARSPARRSAEAPEPDLHVKRERRSVSRVNYAEVGEDEDDKDDEEREYNEAGQDDQAGEDDNSDDHGDHTDEYGEDETEISDDNDGGNDEVADISDEED